MRQEYPDAVVLPARPHCRRRRASVRKKCRDPENPAAQGAPALRGVLHNLTKAEPAHHERPQLNVPTQDSRWFLLCNVDGVTVTTADSRGVVYRQRDRAKMFALLRESMPPAQVRLARFDEMRKVYREALPVLSSKQKWETVLARIVARRWMRLRAVRKPRWWPCSRRWPTGRACLRAHVPFRTSVSTASGGWSSPRWARCCSPDGAGRGWPPGSGRSPRMPPPS